jgi:hypothetical protein
VSQVAIAGAHCAETAKIAKLKIKNTGQKIKTKNQKIQNAAQTLN